LLNSASILTAVLLAANSASGSFSESAPTAVATSSLHASDWKESTPAEQGLDGARLSKLQQQLRDALPHIHSVLVARHGYIVFEYYKQGQRRDDLQEVHSITKSVTSALIGIALEKHFLQGLDQKLVEFLPESVDLNDDPRINEITLRHLLTMTSGFAWNETAKDECARFKLSACSPRYLKFITNDWIGLALERPIVHAPGQVFNYDSAAAHLLSVAVSRATTMSTATFAEQQLFGPLGISRYRWDTDAKGYNYGAYSLELTTRDMAKFGQLYLNRGAWQGRQLIPSDFVDASTHKQNAGGPPAQAYYGYMWWVTPDSEKIPAYFANGRGGQYIIVFPSLDLVVVVTANLDGQKLGIVREFILPAVVR
jgi:CubicO group peptidase (beta-lactamase class C family)